VTPDFEAVPRRTEIRGDGIGPTRWPRSDPPRRHNTDEMTEGMVTIMAVFAQIEKKRLVKKYGRLGKRMLVQGMMNWSSMSLART
jgi:hypothetical protein